MATLLELTSQGDVGTIAEDSKLSSIKLMEPQELYELWERQNWQAHTIDLTQDKKDWAALDEELRENLSWNLSSFFVGEERVTTQFSGLVMAYESQSEEAFLTTQQVDEARHAQHFNRFYEHVMGLDGTFDDRLALARRQLNPAFIEMFDGVLVQWGQRLIENPRDLEAKIDFVTLYHMIIEGTLALTGQWFLTEYMERHEILPGWVQGFRLISQDEHRHVAYGTWFLREKAKDPGLKARIIARLGELLPLTTRVLVPPGADPDSYAILDYTMEETNAFAFNALSRRLKVIGIEMASLAVAASR
jgi:ribonucleoside-diphosphate reductase beta chain